MEGLYTKLNVHCSITDDNVSVCERRYIRVGNAEVRSAMPRILRRTRLLIDTALKEQHVDTHIRSSLAAAAFCWSRGAASSFFAVYDRLNGNID